LAGPMERRRAVVPLSHEQQARYESGMRRLLPIFLATGVVLVVECHRNSHVEGPTRNAQVDAVGLLECSPCPPAEPSHARVVAAVERTACFGMCPIYGVLLHSDGLVEWIGMESVLRVGYCKSKVSAETVASVEAKIDRDWLARQPEGDVPVDAPATLVSTEQSDGGALVRGAGFDDVLRRLPDGGLTREHVDPLAQAARDFEQMVRIDRMAGPEDSSVSTRDGGAYSCPVLGERWFTWFPLMHPPPQ
jgi:hypothetical protein